MSYESLIWNTESDLYNRYKAIKHLVPGSGNCETVEGETLRAIARISYRFFNDGDFYYDGYGCETAGPAHAFLVTKSPIREELSPVLSLPANNDEDKYSEAIDKAMDIVVSWIESKKGEFTPNTECLDAIMCESLYTEAFASGDEECWWCGDDLEYCRCC